MQELFFGDGLNLSTVLFRFFLSFLFSGIIGFERSRHGRPAGLRTHIIVCIGACLSAMLGLFTCLDLGFPSDPMRVSAQVISGIGFLGAGTILLRGRNHVTGLTTAAGLWTTATIGIAAGVGFYTGAVICTIIFFLAAGALNRIETIGKNGKNIIRIYMESDDASFTNTIINTVTRSEYGLYAIEITPPRTGIANHLGIEAIMPIGKQMDRKASVDRLACIDHILFAVESV